jgi:phosphoglycolate phosphatase-like HAD superfamily hydrolase
VDAKDAAFIGDMDGDIVCGKAAKIGKIIAVTYGFHLKHRLKDADVIIDSPEELLTLL